MRWTAALVAIALCLPALATPGSGGAETYSFGKWTAEELARWDVLVTNETGEFRAALLAERGPPYHAGDGERVVLVVNHTESISGLDYPVLGLDNVTVDEDEYSFVTSNGTDGFLKDQWNGTIDWFIAVYSIVVPSQDAWLNATVSRWDGEVNLSYRMEVAGPERSILSVRLERVNETYVDENGITRVRWFNRIPEGGERTFTVLVENHGGEPVTDIVLDFRVNMSEIYYYDGIWTSDADEPSEPTLSTPHEYVLSTEEVPYVPARGNATLELTVPAGPEFSAFESAIDFRSYFNDHHFIWWNDIEVHILRGPGAPRWIDTLYFSIEPRGVPVLTGVVVEPTSVRTGEEVSITAEVGNVGSAPVSDQVLEFLVDGYVVDNVSVSISTRLHDNAIGITIPPEVTFNWTATTPGVHSLAVRLAGDEASATPVAVEVTEEAPGPGTVLVSLALVLAALVTTAARRSAPAGRA